MTAATQPSIEDIVLGALPWIPKVHFHNSFLAGTDLLTGQPITRAVVALRFVVAVIDAQGESRADELAC
jgi:hypothetical protein